MVKAMWFVAKIESDAFDVATITAFPATVTAKSPIDTPAR